MPFVRAESVPRQDRFSSTTGAFRLYDPQLTPVCAVDPGLDPGPQRPALRNGDLALTSTRIPAGATTEVARRQPDGTWLWTIDQPNILST